MRVDPDKSIYHEDPQARSDFNRRELRSLRILLRRLRFLEASVAKTGGLEDGSANGGGAFAEWEIEALEYVLTEIGFLAEPPARVSGL